METIFPILKGCGNRRQGGRNHTTRVGGEDGGTKVEASTFGSPNSIWMELHVRVLKEIGATERHGECILRARPRGRWREGYASRGGRRRKREGCPSIASSLTIINKL